MAMTRSTLNLTVDKGPKQGETIVRDPGEVIRIGRVVRGNNFPIKDPGISQKHLTIEFAGEISRWTVSDLDTSNGTIVNGSKIQSLTPFPLSDGDTIKIGEKTTISVKVECGRETGGGLRRGRSRGVRSRAVSLESVVEEVRVEEPNNLGRGRTRRGHSSRVSKKDEILDAVEGDSVEVRPKRACTRAASGRILKDEGNVEVDPKKNEPLELVAEDSMEVPNNARRGRAKRALARTHASTAKVVHVHEVIQTDSVAEGAIEREEVNIESNAAADAGRAPAQTWASTDKAVQADEVVQTDSVVEGVVEKEEVNVESHVSADAGKEAENVQGEKGKRVEEENVVDLEKMTLGEWFDSMEKYLPQAINEVAEKMIASLW